MEPGPVSPQPRTQESAIPDLCVRQKELKKEYKNEPREGKAHTSRGASAPDPRVKTFIDWYFTEHEAKGFGTLVVKGGQDGKNVKEMLAALGIDELQARASRFLADRDGWPKGDKSIGALFQVINRYGQEKLDAREGCSKVVSETFRRSMEAARAAMEGER